MRDFLLVAIGFLVGVIFAKYYKTASSDKKRESLIARQAEEKRRNKEAILGLLETQGRMTNNHVEQMLGISDATATRYLEELEKEGKVRQVGTTGHAVYYEKI